MKMMCVVSLYICYFQTFQYFYFWCFKYILESTAKDHVTATKWSWFRLVFRFRLGFKKSNFLCFLLLFGENKPHSTAHNYGEDYCDSTLFFLPILQDPLYVF